METYTSKTGIRFTLTQEAYLGTWYGEPMYMADAVNQFGEEYIILWEIDKDAEDESECCDWDHPTNVVKY